MNQIFVSYCGIGVLVASAIYAVKRRIRLISGPSINDSLVEVSLATCPLQGHWAMPLVIGVGYSLVAAGVVIGWPYALIINIRKWARYKPPMSEEEYKTELRELRERLSKIPPMGPEEMEAERKALRKMVAIQNLQKS